MLQNISISNECCFLFDLFMYLSIYLFIKWKNPEQSSTIMFKVQIYLVFE